MNPFCHDDELPKLIEISRVIMDSQIMLANELQHLYGAEEYENEDGEFDTHYALMLGTVMSN